MERKSRGAAVSSSSSRPATVNTVGASPTRGREATTAGSSARDRCRRGPARRSTSPCAKLTAVVFARLFPLLLALCALLPADLRARMIESCRAPEQCCCRRNEPLQPPQGPIARRVDCCEAPCAIEHTSGVTTVPARREFSEPDGWIECSPPIEIRATSAVEPTGPRRGRDPPQRLYALTQRWLL